MTLPLTRLRAAAIAALLLAMGAARGAAQEAALVLTVTAQETQAPLQGAQVKLDDRGVAVTDAEGGARVPMAPGAHRVEVSAIGRHPQTLTATLAAGETQDVEVRLAPEAVPLQPVTASATPAAARTPMLQAFYDRAANHSNGRFYTREYIERRKPQELTDVLLDGTGLKWEYSEGGHRRLRFRRAVSGQEGSRDCPPKYYVNGFPMDMELMSRDPSPDLFVHIDDVEGVEVYPDIPPAQYNATGSGCGVILIWLRADAAGSAPAPAGKGG